MAAQLRKAAAESPKLSRSAAEVSPAGPLSGASLEGDWTGTSPTYARASGSRTAAQWQKQKPHPEDNAVSTEEYASKKEAKRRKAPPKPKRVSDVVFNCLFTSVKDEDYADCEALSENDTNQPWWAKQQLGTVPGEEEAIDTDWERPDKFVLRPAIKWGLWCFWFVLVVLALKHLVDCSWAHSVVVDVVEVERLPVEVLGGLDLGRFDAGATGDTDDVDNTAAQPVDSDDVDNTAAQPVDSDDDVDNTVAQPVDTGETLGSDSEST